MSQPIMGLLNSFLYDTLYTNASIETLFSFTYFIEVNSTKNKYKEYFEISENKGFFSD